MNKVFNWKRILIISISIFIIAVPLYRFYKWLLLKIGDYLIVQDNLYPVDVIHVIAGDDYRTEYAIQLYKQGYAKYIFFTGGWCTIHGWYHGLHGQQLALDQGIPPGAIAYDDSVVTSTFSETLRLKDWMDKNPILTRSVIVVSDPFHMRRARWTNRFILGNKITTLMAPVPFDQTPFTLQWWNDKASTNYVKEEYIKFVYYFLRYRLSLTWLAPFDKE
jgi:uncharacterized SAM-binding protein YcdF (DUF218 family)